jgi:hypothetical protein
MPPMKILPPCFAAIAARAAPLSGMLRIVPVEALVVAIEPKGLLVITSVKASGWSGKPYTANVSAPPPCPPTSRFKVAETRDWLDRSGMANSNQLRNWARFVPLENDVAPAK